MSLAFSIKFPIEPYKIINEKSRIVLLGSCFTEHIGSKLNDSGFDCTINPFGNLFNPLSIANSLNRIIAKQTYKSKELTLTHEHRYVSFDHHGEFSGIDANIVLGEINEALEQAHTKLKSADCLILTLGSAWVYRHLDQNQIVANCHKISASEFAKERLKIETIVDALIAIISTLKAFNPNLKIIFTISPVKHLSDGVIENQQSKASLILALADIMQRKQNDIYYFPAYEIVNDELRDYRFYESDCAHPNSMAIDYVWQRFKETCFTPKAIEKVNDAEMIFKALEHRPLHSDGLNVNLHHKIKMYLKKYQID